MMMKGDTLGESRFKLGWFFSFFQRLSDHFTRFFSPCVEINFPELQGLQLNQAYLAINAYLGSKGTDKANCLSASQVRDVKGLVLKREGKTMNDEYKGFKVWWKNVTSPNGDKSYQLTFHSRARSVITTAYIQYVVEEGTLLHTKNKKMKLLSNEQSIWRINDFEHPASFQTFAMDPEKKQEIIDDLIAFINGKEYYKKIGKAWKRGYLLYGPPGTGKSTMIAAMANLLNYCIYDLDLTSVHNNLDLKKMLTTTFSRSIIVIGDIDCSVNLTGNRIQKDNLRKNGEQSKEERIIVFTTNHLQKLDPALIRRGRMDMRIELSYCTYEAFKILAKNCWKCPEIYLLYLSAAQVRTLKKNKRQKVYLRFDLDGTSIPIIVIGDIDCSVNLTGNRIQKDNLRKNGEQSKEERIIVFTTNHLQKLDPALIRRGRMDMRIELSYCTYEAFKILAKNCWKCPEIYLLYLL
ncbi:hypothetical protein DY000_02023384 [Brassica cretica]|uniref:AAA+ ATPase domain-containing protein n=1 Tax=Brassica cretica TaxID=69181 RepID=A0ABQ7E2Q9_BRACR|nr:hypothetical protein DY000_02023384 [Brassica cretica]